MLKNKPNLLIKGNNLIALHSLKEYFRHQSEQNKVKLIYIDPPYNTGSDSFNYNDRFNHSTYLTFMKNRLEIARELLRDDGVIFVQCDDNEQAYLKVLMDEIFGRENFVATAPRKTGAGAAAKNSDYALRKPYDFIIMYGKNKLQVSFNKLLKGEKEYKFSDENGNYTVGSFQATGSDATRESRPNLYYPIYVNKNNTLSLERTFDTVLELLPNKIKGKDGRWMWKQDKFLKDKDKFLFFDGNKINRKIYFNEEEDQNIYQVEKAYFDDVEFQNSKGTKEVQELLGYNVFSNPKPEFLIKKLLEISTNENDLVLDFFAGSGTTLAVAHKMKRRYIGIEQMEYIESITKERLKKVIEGEQGGISKAVSWSGGGNLIYCELASLNAKFIEKIENSSDENELNQIYENLQKLAFIDYRVDIQNDLKDDEFSNLDFTSKKRILKKCLDRNMDYIPYADIDDSEYKIDERAKKLNKIFYGENDG